MEQVDPPRRERGSADTQLMKTAHATAREAKEEGDICGIRKETTVQRVAFEDQRLHRSFRPSAVLPPVHSNLPTTASQNQPPPILARAVEYDNGRFP
jgi:hypothetical protein